MATELFAKLYYMKLVLLDGEDSTDDVVNTSEGDTHNSEDLLGM